MGRKFGMLVYRLILALVMLICIFIGFGCAWHAQDKVFTGVLSLSLRLLFPLMLAGLICLFVVLLYRAMDRFSRRQLIAASVVMFAVMALVFLVLFLNFKVTPAGDAMHVQDVALYFAKTGKVPLTKTAPHAGYFARFANNYFLVVVLRCYYKLCLLLGIQDMYVPTFLLGFAAIMVSAVFLYLTGVLLGGLRKGTRLLTLCVMNPLYYLLALWVYTNGLSIPFVTASVYFSLRVYKAKSVCSRRIFCVLTAVVTVLGYYVRPTSVIPVIAVAACAFLWGLRKRENMIRVLRCAVLCIVTAAILFKAISVVNDWHFSAVSDGNFPPTHWLMMASHGTGRHNDRDVNFTLQFETIEEKTKATIEKTIENYREQTAAGLITFIGQKMLEVWGRGDGGDLLANIKSDTKMTKLYDWLVGSRADLFQAYGYAFRMATLFLMVIALWNLLRKKEIDPAQFVFVLSLFGGILFYCFWEIKTKYSLPFVCLMLAVASHGAEVLAAPTTVRQRRMHRAARPAAAAVSLVCALGICALAYHDVVRSNVTLRDWSLNEKKNSSMSAILPDAKEIELTQEVYISKPFDQIVISGNADDTAVQAGDSALMTIRDGSGRIVFERTIGAQELMENNYLKIATGEIIPNGREKFVIGITKSDDCRGKLFFRCRANRYLDLYDGVLTVNGETHRSDLFLQIYREYEGAWCSVKTARILFGALALGILLLYLWMYLDARREKEMR